ncbi:MAG: glutathione S-transferase family protein [Pseudomonadales bacterium]
MKLIGAYSSPYTRRVAITLRHYGIAHDIKKVTPFGRTKARLRQINPVARIPILALDDGEFVTESQVILDYLDMLVPEHQRLTPSSGPERRKIQNLCGIASAAVDKLVTVLYEFHFRPKDKVYKPWTKMCDEQTADGFRWLDAQLVNGRFFGSQITQAEITVAVFWQFAVEKRTRFCERMDCTQLQALSDEMEQTAPFLATTPEGPIPEGMTLGTRE